MSELATFLGAASNHGGQIISTPAVKTYVKVGGGQILVAAEGAMHACPIPGHGVTPISASSIKNYIEGNKIVRTVDFAGCGASSFTPCDHTESV